MYLKRLEIQGFKSFAQHGEINFGTGTGITCIVGPNGCGKSNIYDAINWVMGEQRAKSLRGSRMEDLIFAGSSGLKAMGMAEVSLTFGDAEKLNLEYSEVTVTRRLYRTGESEYLINRKNCRLKDIQDVFSGTGVGLNSYSMMGQGNVDFIVNSKPNDRRFLFEEVAGTAKFRVKKMEAERKLDHTRANLLRIGDILDEISRQKNAVNRQAAKAKRYKSLSAQLKRYDVTLALDRLASFNRQVDQVDNGMRDVHKIQAGLKNQIASIGQEVAALRKEVEVRQKENAAGLKLLNEVSEKISSASNKISYNTQRHEDLTRRDGFLTEEIKVLEKNIQELEHANRLLEVEQNGLEDQIGDAKKALDTAVDEQAKTNARIEMLKAQIDTVRMQALELKKQIADKNNSMLSAQTRQKLLEERSLKIKSAQTPLKERVELDTQQLGVLKENLETVKTAIEQANDELAGIEQARRQIQSRRQGIENSFMETEREIAQQESRLKFLQGLKDGFEGYKNAVKQLMAAQKTLGLERNIVPLGEIVNPAEKYAMAVEAALGRRLDDVVVFSMADAVKCIEFLKREKLGRVRFVVEELCAKKTTTPAKAPQNAVGHLPDLVNAPEKYKQSINALFEGVYVVKDIEKSDAAAGARLVDEGGQLVFADGVLTGGSKSEQVSDILVRQEKIKTTQEKLDKLLEHRSGLNVQLESLRQEEMSLLESCDSVQQRLGTERQKYSLEQTRIQSLELECESKRREFDNNAREITQIGDEIQVLSTQIEHLKIEVAQLAEQDKNSLSNVEVQQGQLEELEDQKRVLLEDQMEKKIAYNALAQKHLHLVGKLKDYTSNCQRFKTDLSARKTEQEQIGVLCEQIKKESVELAKVVEEEGRKKGHMQEKQHVLTMLVTDHNAKLEQLVLKQEGVRQELEKTLESGSRREVELAEIKVKRTSLIEHIREEYEFDLEKDALDETQDEEDPVPMENLAAEVEEIKNRIKNLGPVNMVAIDEYEELEKRFEFLSQQKKDLVDAEQMLRKAIDEINKTSCRLFSETFETVRENFKQTFAMLFHGGQADIFLTDPDNILESGIDIEARPGGSKKKQFLSLLSGGEKAMTSIALLFAIFLTKPSPFCIMDEVDAPLDDTNISRFIDMVKDFSSTTQFIIVTHNKKTMAAADQIHGVSVDRTGTSKMVSLQLAEASAISS